ncbi:hypothetical protein LPJ60_006280, partial [Coemansia sp. RSA 2675]
TGTDGDDYHHANQTGGNDPASCKYAKLKDGIHILVHMAWRYDDIRSKMLKGLLQGENTSYQEFRTWLMEPAGDEDLLNFHVAYGWLLSNKPTADNIRGSGFFDGDLIAPPEEQPNKR